MKTEELFALANRAKGVGVYKIANIIFAHLALTSDQSTDIDWEIETDYIDGFPGYYDLLVVFNKENGWYLNIPVPLLNKEVLHWMFGSFDYSRFVDRGTHCRSHETLTEEQVEGLWTELHELLTDDQIKTAAECLLEDTSKAGELYGVPFAERNKEYTGFIFFAVEVPGNQYDWREEGLIVIVSWRNDGQSLPSGAIEICRDSGEPNPDLPDQVLKAFRDLKSGVVDGKWQGYHPSIEWNLPSTVEPQRDDRDVLVGTAASFAQWAQKYARTA